MAAELYAEAGSRVALRLTPGDDGVLQVFMNGQKLYDRAEAGGQYPDLNRVKGLRVAIGQQVAAAG